MKSRFALSEENLVRMVALLTATMGVVNVISAVTPSLKYRLRLLEQYSPFRVSIGGHLTSALAGFALILLSVSLWRQAIGMASYSDNTAHFHSNTSLEGFGL